MWHLQGHKASSRSNIRFAEYLIKFFRVDTTLCKKNSLLVDRYASLLANLGPSAQHKV